MKTNFTNLFVCAMFTCSALISCSEEYLPDTAIGAKAEFSSNVNIELVSIHSDNVSFSPVYPGEVNTRADFSPIKEDQFYSLKFDNMSSLYSFIEDKENADAVLNEVKKMHPGFVSILDIFKEAMIWSDKYLNETRESYDTWKNLYGNYLYFPEYEEDYGAYIPISDQSLAALSNSMGKVVIGDQIVSMKDIFSYEDFQEKGKDAYYSINSSDDYENIIKLSSDPCYHHYQLVGNLYDCNDEYDSGWTEKNSRKLRVKVGRQAGKNGVRIHIEISFRKKTILGWSNYSSVTESLFTFNGETKSLRKSENSSHDFYLDDAPFIGGVYPPVPVTFCREAPTAKPTWNMSYIRAQPWSISINFQGFSDPVYRFNKSSTIPLMYFYRPI